MGLPVSESKLGVCGFPGLCHKSLLHNFSFLEGLFLSGGCYRRFSGFRVWNRCYLVFGRAPESR